MTPGRDSARFPRTARDIARERRRRTRLTGAEQGVVIDSVADTTTPDDFVKEEGGVVFWAHDLESGKGGIFRIDAVGSTPVPLVENIKPTSLAVDSQALYYSDALDASQQHGIWCVPRAGGVPVRMAKSGAKVLVIGADAQHVYWREDNVASHAARSGRSSSLGSSKPRSV
ncbi:MAG: hypothetical protein IPI67_40095 [Myxococcales bacterium]|nr:hypothetical protein [Myxococcales bacterium]